MAREKLVVVPDPADPKSATVSVGPDDWPMPIPIVSDGKRWRFDTEAGREEVFLRRIGMNELDAIAVCRRFVEAQHEYASEKRDGSRVNQYAQKVIATPGRQDGLAWQNADGTWSGPMAEGDRPRHRRGLSRQAGALPRLLLQGPEGPGAVGAPGRAGLRRPGGHDRRLRPRRRPADYEKTGVKTFIVSHEGVVYEKDLGPGTLEVFRVMERYDPDESWSPVEEP